MKFYFSFTNCKNFLSRIHIIVRIWHDEGQTFRNEITEEIEI